MLISLIVWSVTGELVLSYSKPSSLGNFLSASRLHTAPTEQKPLDGDLLAAVFSAPDCLSVTSVPSSLCARAVSSWNNPHFRSESRCGAGEQAQSLAVPLGCAPNSPKGLPVLEVVQPLALKGGVGWSHRYVNVCSLSSLSVAVIGQKVNLAARLMEYYPGLVSCDAATYAASRLPRSYFKELPEVKMKGVVDPGTVYQYLGISEKSEYSPLLGREKEIALFESSLKAYVDRKESHIMAFEGVIGSGKSHLLTELAYLGQAAGHRAVAVELTELNLKQVYSAMHMVLWVAMGLQACKSCSARQLVLQEKLRGLVEESSYCLLNAPFLVKFPLSEKVSKMSGAQRTMELESFFKKVLQKTVEEGVVVLFVIDNAHYIDSTSWAVMLHVLRDVPIFLVMGFAPGHCRRQRLCKAAADIMKLQQTTYVPLEELKPSAVVQKACQDLGVVSVARDLETFLMQRSYGIPYYCEELLSYLNRHGMLLFHLLRKDEKTEAKRESLFSKLKSTVSCVEANAASPGLASGEGKREICGSFLTGIALAELDSMKPSEQMVLKCAAIIGPTFTTELLFHILPRWTRTKMNEALTVLVRGHILKWLNAEKVAEDSSKQSLGETEKTARLQSGVLAFCTPLLREAAYELWPKAQRVAMHCKCACCGGGGDFVAFHRFAVSGTWEGQNCDNYAGECYSPSWQASLVKNKEAKRDELPAATGMLKGTHSAVCSCECKAIVELVLVPLAQHHMAMGNDARALYHLLERAAAYLHVSNNYLAFMNLSRAEVLRSSGAKKAKVLACFEEATFLSLKGEVCYNMGCMDLAKTTIRKALSLLNRKFPVTSLVAVAQQFPLCGRRERLPWLFRQSRCLSLLQQLFSLESTSSGRRLSRLAALMKVNTAEESEDASHVTAFSLDNKAAEGSTAFLRYVCVTGWEYKSFEECRSFVEQNEANRILKSQKSILFGLYSSLALWFARLGQWDSFQKPFEKARRLLKRADASVFATQACSRLLECYTLVLKNDIEHSSARAWESCPGALRLAEEVFSRCSTSPVFYPRVYHLKVYIFRMLGNEEQSLLCLNQGLQACEVNGNLLEKTWLEMCTEWWFAGKGPVGDLWLKTAPRLPQLKQAKAEGCSSRYLLQLPALRSKDALPGIK
uniref:Orc1-like AAA ATPase domain-containing protein n=1 Tax=Apteryx owenii TaxID=8824 RepID=A0A8B9SAV0_APTOW